ncbi:MAG: Flagellar motor rotation protein MotB [Myxococcales bacterium]|nr:Flagellar motor rotation protein MotB [Myxococcales bacterium]
MAKDDHKKWIIAIIAGVLFGSIVGFLLKPSHADEAEKAKKDLAEAEKSATALKIRAEGLDKELAAVKKDKDDADEKLKEASDKVANADKKVAEADAIQKKLQGTIDKSQGSVSQEGDEIHLKLVDKVLFAVGDDQLTDKGKAVLDKVAVALKEVPEKQIWVQGHTDDTPIVPVAVKKEPPPKPDPKAKKGAKPVKEPPPPPVKLMTNWELSANRALNVVHYLQDVDKIDPSRLAALAFGQYRPVSKANKAANRRIEIVLYPKPKLQR